jgi:hypothetical protein
MTMQIVYRNIRFSAKVDRCLRRRWRMHGDLSIRVREALDGVNLLDVELLDVDSQPGPCNAGWCIRVWVARRPRGGERARMLCEHAGE